MSIYKDCDIRGVFGREFDEDDAYLIGRAIATIAEGGVLAVGGDVRLSTPRLRERLIEGLCLSGARCLDLGRIATPELYFALKSGVPDGGVMVTASHNPKEYNGFKFMFGRMPVTRETIRGVAEIVDEGAFAEGAGARLEADINEGYLKSLAERFRAAKGLKIVVDAGNGCMSELAPEALSRSGHTPVPLFCEPDGAFPNRTPNPAELDKLTALRETVVRERADFGVAFDGDGDRAVFVTDAGEALVSERALALFVNYLLADGPTPVVYDQKSSSVVRDAIVKMGGEPVPEKSGHTYIKRRFLALGAKLAGEVSGHFFFGELGYDDALYAALLMAELIEKAGKPLSELVSGVVCPPITPDIRVPCPYAKQDEALGRVRALGKGHKTSELDGVRIEFADGWLLARKSVTSEQLTLRIEAADGSAMARIRELLLRALPEAASYLKEAAV